MRSLRYLNTVLTIIAILLTLQLWTLWTTGGRDGSQAIEIASVAHAGGIPNAGMQRKQTNDLLKALLQKTEELTGLFKSGRARMRLDQPSGKDAK
jgi:hypothetical protein